MFVNPRLTKALAAYLEGWPEVTHFIECVGSWDYEIDLETKRADQITSFTRALYENFGNSLRSLKVIPVFGHLKYKGYPYRVDSLPL